MKTKAKAQERRRLDVALVEAGLVPSREQARRLVMAGQVRVDGKVADKPGQAVDLAQKLEIVGDANPFVSRGGLKLAAALAAFPVDPRGKIALDVGASTGGFTDCLLQHGATQVYAFDVGYGQLAWKLRQDSRVRVRERTNIRYVTADQFDAGLPELATIDVSFISLELVLPVLASFLPPGAPVLALVKPQFEAGPEKVGKHGVVRDPAVHRAVLNRFGQAARQFGYALRGLIPSPIRGPEGNVEFLAWLTCPNPSPALAAGSPSGSSSALAGQRQPVTGPASGLSQAEWEQRVDQVVAQAHAPTHPSGPTRSAESGV